MTRTACLLCGAEDQGTRVSLVEWIDPQPGQRWTTLPRCIDRASCRQRVEASGVRWEVNDGTPAIAVASVPADPMPVSATAPADGAEWLDG